MSGDHWQQAQEFEQLASTPIGQILVGKAGNLSYSPDSGRTWSRHTDFPGYSNDGSGQTTIACALGSRLGEFIVSVTTLQAGNAKHVNGSLFRLNQSGSMEKITTTLSSPITGMTEDLEGNLYGSTYQNETGELLKSTDRGASWTNVGTSNSRLLTMNSLKQIVGVRSDGTLTFGSIGGTQSRLLLSGASVDIGIVRDAKFNLADILFIATEHSGIIRTSDALR